MKDEGGSVDRKNPARFPPSCIANAEIAHFWGRFFFLCVSAGKFQFGCGSAALWLRVKIPRMRHWMTG
jgi:hypothetical protein